jgi:AcrR family transcriptional regulator
MVLLSTVTMKKPGDADRATKSRGNIGRRRRLRRDPEAARAHILEAAKRVLAERGPDAAGLKKVAREAGVSHALVTHYFGTYESLVEAALEDNALRARRAILSRLADDTAGAPLEMIELFFDTLETPLHGRLLAWAMLTGRIGREDFFARRVQGPKLVVDAIIQRFSRVGIALDREEVERLVVLVMAVGFGTALAGDTIWRALGETPTEEKRKEFRRWLAELIGIKIAGGTFG